MAQKLIQLTIFFSGTSESEAERSAIKLIVEELNRMLAKSNNIILRIMSWPNDFRPGINKDPQSEINRQIQGQYDIFIGILGSRFGTQTPRAGSGTEEEFQIAITHFLQDTTSVRVLFYFNRTLQDPFSIDAEQLLKVKKFRTELPSKGVLYMDFKDTANFVEIVKDHLWNLISEEWNGTNWKKIEVSKKMDIIEDKEEENKKNETNNLVASEIIIPSSDSNDLQSEEIGYFDLLEEFYSIVESMISKFGKMLTYTIQIGNQFRIHTKSINELMDKYGNKQNIGGSRVAQGYLSSAKELVDSSAQDLEVYTTNMKPLVSIIKIDLSSISNHFRNVYFAEERLGKSNEQKIKDVAALNYFYENMKNVVEQMTSFQRTISILPALTTKFNKAKRHATSMLGELIAEMKIAIDQGSSILSQINEA